MRKITTWVVSTLAVVALAIGFQINLAGGGGKAAEGGDHGAVVQPQDGGSVSDEPSVAPDGGSTGDDSDHASTDDEKSGGETNDQTGKPGENK